MPDVPVLRLPIDSSDFDEFSDKFMRYQKKLDEQPDAWAGTARGVRNTKREMADMHSAFSKLMTRSVDQRGGAGGSSVFDKFAKAGKDPKLTGDQSFIKKFLKDSKETDRAWEGVVKSITASEKGMSSLLRLGMGFGGIFGLLGGAGIGLLEATKSAANDAADQNKSSKSLGLELGKESAFTTYGASLGLTRQNLEDAANAQADPTLRTPFVTAGITQNQFATEDSAQLAWDAAKNKARMYSEWQDINPATALNQAQARGWQDSPDELRLLASNYRSGNLDKMRGQYEANWQQMGLDQKTADQGTAAKTQFDAAWAKDVKAFDEAFVKLTPKFVELETDFSNWLTTFAKSGELDADIKLVTGGFDDLVAVFKKLGLINDTTQDTDKGLNKADNAVGKSGWETGNWLEKEFPSYAKWRKENSSWLGADSDGGVGTGTLDDTNDPAYKKHLMDAVADIESGGVNGQTNKTTGAAGIYQITPENYKAAGVDPFDPKASRDLATSIMDGYIREFNGDMAKAVAAYDGDSHVAKDGADWLSKAKPETLNYLRKMEAHGISLGLSPEDQKYVDEHTVALKDIRAKNAAAQPDMSDFGKIEPYDEGSQGTPDSAQAGGNGAVSGYLDRLRDGFADIGDFLRDGGGSQFRMPDQSNKGAQSSNLTPTNIQVSLIQPAGSSLYISSAGIPS
jgi:Transglycosylase SLT domain